MYDHVLHECGRSRRNLSVPLLDNSVNSALGLHSASPFLPTAIPAGSSGGDAQIFGRNCHFDVSTWPLFQDLRLDCLTEAAATAAWCLPHSFRDPYVHKLSNAQDALTSSLARPYTTQVYEAQVYEATRSCETMCACTSKKHMLCSGNAKDVQSAHCSWRSRFRSLRFCDALCQQKATYSHPGHHFARRMAGEFAPWRGRGRGPQFHPPKDLGGFGKCPMSKGLNQKTLHAKDCACLIC